MAAGMYLRRFERWGKRAERSTARATERMKRALDVRKVWSIINHKLFYILKVEASPQDAPALSLACLLRQATRFLFGIL